MNVVENDTDKPYPGSYLLALGPDGFARIIYVKSDASLWIYTCHDQDCSPGGITSHQIADGTNHPGRYGMEISMGYDGFPRIAYFDDGGTYANHFVRCLDDECASFHDTVVGGENTDGEATISLTMGLDGFARIVYSNVNGTLDYVKCTDDDCSDSPVIATIADSGDPDNPPGWDGVVARIGSDGFAHILYSNIDYYGTNDNKNMLHYVACSDANCTLTTDVMVATDASEGRFGLAIRSGNLASIAYGIDPGWDLHITDSVVHLINCTNGNCSSSNIITVDPSYAYWAANEGCALVVDSNNLPRLVYSNGDEGQRYTRFASLNGEDISTPSIASEPAVNITSTSATLQATLTDDGGETPTVELKWGTYSGSYPNTCTPVTNVGGGYSCDLTGLTADTTYYVQASATNSGGTGDGSEVSFRTTVEDVVDPPVSSENPGITDNGCKPKKLTSKIFPGGKVRLAWKKTCDATDKIEIERKSDAGKFEEIATVKRDKLTYVDEEPGLSPGKYTYRIRGYRKASGKHSEYSDTESVTIERSASSAVIKRDESVVMSPPEVEAPKNQPERHVSEPNNTTPATQPDSPALSVLGTAIAAVKRSVYTSVVGLTVAVITGLVAGAVMVGSSAEIPLFATSPTPISEAVSRLFGMFGLVGKKKREDGWGIVFDSETRRPVSGASISIINEEGHVVDTSLSDSHGRYGFLPSPGTYTLVISKKDYELEKNDRQDILYGDLYIGQPIVIRENKLEKISIALKTTTIDWQDFARRKVAAYTSTFSIVKRDLFLVLFYAGFVINSGIAFLFPTILNAILFVIYLGMVIYYLFFRKKAYGLVTNVQTRQPVPFAMMSIYDVMDSQKRVAFAVSDVVGRYFIFAENGEYLLKVSGNFLGGSHFEKMLPIEVEDGIVRNDVEV